MCFSALVGKPKGHALGDSISGLIKKPTFSCSLHSTPGRICLRLGVLFYLVFLSRLQQAALILAIRRRHQSQRMGENKKATLALPNGPPHAGVGALISW